MKEVKVKKSYGNPIGITQQFRFCGNPLRIDMYKDCGFQCNYCFAKTIVGRSMSINCADIEKIKRLFYRAFETNEETTNLVVELLRRKTPLHCGGLSDPFQPIEFHLHLTYELIKLSNKYEVPISFSTKQCYLPQEYWEILNPELHAFQVSLIGIDAEWLKKYEPNTPTPQERLGFMKQLHEKGFWVGMRIQPLIDLDQATRVALEAENYVDYITIEHLKVATNNTYQMQLFNVSSKTPEYYHPKSSRHFVVRRDIKEANIKSIMSKITKCKIGVGDNDLHHLSQSRCCCGIDTIRGGKFNNYLKYNLTYFATSDNMSVEEKDNLYVPESSCSGCFNEHCVIKGITKVKDYTDKYCVDNIDLLKHEPELYAFYQKYFIDFNNWKRFSKRQTDKDQLSLFDSWDEGAEEYEETDTD